MPWTTRQKTSPRARPTAAEAEATGQRAFDFAAKVLPHVLVETVAATKMPEAADPHELPCRRPSGEWLLAQKDRKCWIGELSRAFKVNRNFPRCGDPDDIRKYLCEVRAERDADEALDDAELHWASY